MAEAGKRQRTLGRDGGPPRARVAVRTGKVFVEVYSTSHAAELAIRLAMVQAARRAGPGACLVGPHMLSDAQPPKCYGRLLLAGAERTELAGVREAAARVLRQAGYLVLPETVSRRTIPKGR